MLLKCNVEDKFAVAVMKSGAVVRHVPKTLAPVISQFLKQDCNKGVVYITGKRINRGGGFGLEAPLSAMRSTGLPQEVEGAGGCCWRDC